MLDLPKINDDLDVKLVKNLVGRLRKKFSLTSYKDLDEAVCLANYLFSLGHKDAAKRLLESFVFDVEYQEDREDLWGSNGLGIILLAHIYGVNDVEKELRLINKINENDIMTSNARRADLFKEDLEDHQSKMAYAESETQKYKCEVISGESLKFLYYLEMLPFYKDDVAEDFSNNLRSLIDNCYRQLSLALKS